MAGCTCENWSLQDLSSALQDMHKDNKRIVVPMFQRGKRWKKAQEQKFIDSLIKGYPVGTMLFYETYEDNKRTYILVDGLQRGNSIKKYMTNPTEFFYDDSISDEFCCSVLKLVHQSDEKELYTKIRGILTAFIKEQKTFKNLQYFSVAKQIADEFSAGFEPIEQLIEVIKIFFEERQDLYDRIASTIIPVIVYTGDENNLPEIFDRINSQGTPLDQYEVYAAAWPVKQKFAIKNADIVEHVVRKYDTFEEDDFKIHGYNREESLFVISDSDKKDPGTDTILTLRPVHPWDRMDEDEFVQCIKGIVPNPAVQIEIETDKRSESYSSDYFDDLDLSPLLDYSWNNTKNIRKIDIDLTCEEYGFKGRGCIGLLIKNDMPVEEIEILSKDVEIDGEIYTLSSSVKYKNNCITETSTSISVDEDGEIDTNTSWSERFKSKSSLSIHGIEVPYNLFPNYSNKMSKAVLNIPFPFSFRLDIGVNSDLNLNSARDQIIYDEKWLTFEENLYQVICKRLKEQLSLSDWERLNEIIQKNGKNIFSRVANNIE